MTSAQTVLKIAEKICELDQTGIGKAITGSLSEIIKAAQVWSYVCQAEEFDSRGIDVGGERSRDTGPHRDC
jgi:hypothetical protein